MSSDSKETLGNQFAGAVTRADRRGADRTDFCRLYTQIHLCEICERKGAQRRCQSWRI